MRTALDRLLARPSALPILRNLVTEANLSFASLLRSPCHIPRMSAFNGAQNIHRRPYGVSETQVQEQEDNGNGAEASRYLRRSPASSTPPVAHGDSTAGAQSSIDSWIQILQFRKRVYGADGARETWRDLRENQVDLPTSGTEAKILWETFLTETHILEDVISYAEDLQLRTGQSYGALYGSVIGQCFAERRHPDVYRWHTRLMPTFPPAEGALRSISSKVTGGKTSILAFRWLYARNLQRDVHDALTSSLWQKGLYNTALKCHIWLARSGDVSQNLVANTPMQESFRKYLLNMSIISHKGSREVMKSISSQEPPLAEAVPFGPDSVSQLLRKSHGAEPQQLDDHFCARLFATRAFSLEIVISGLVLVGVEAIGPLALRELASRAHDCSTLTHLIKRLKDEGISIGRSVYSQAIEKFASNNRLDLLQALLSTDQHPDAFEDQKLQRKLLESYVRREEWREVHRTLAILTIYYDNPVTEQWNLLVRTRSKQGDLDKLCNVLEDMRLRGVTLTEKSMGVLQVHRLRLRQRGKAPSTFTNFVHDDTTLISNIWCSTLQSGGNVDPRRWTEIFRRFGTSNRFNEVAKVALWLAAWYSQQGAHASKESLWLNRAMKSARNRDSESSFSDSPLVVKPTHPAHPLRQIFSPNQQRAFIAWGINSAFFHKENEKKPSHCWARGIQLLKILRDRGVYVSTLTVRKELKLRLIILFGRGSSKVHRNRRSRLNNLYSIQEMIRHANELWGPKTPLIELERVRNTQKKLTRRHREAGEAREMRRHEELERREQTWNELSEEDEAKLGNDVQDDLKFSDDLFDLEPPPEEQSWLSEEQPWLSEEYDSLGFSDTPSDFAFPPDGQSRQGRK